jgi:hypothetical protein
MSQILCKWIFLVSIKFKNNAKLVQKKIFFFYWPEEFWKQIFVPETDKMCQFLAPETEPKHQFLGPEIMLTHFQDFWGQKMTKCVSFLAQKLFKWVRN